MWMQKEREVCNKRLKMRYVDGIGKSNNNHIFSTILMCLNQTKPKLSWP